MTALDLRMWYFNLISPFYSLFRRDEREAAFVAEWLDPAPDGRILDAGAGPGRHAVALARRYPEARVTAVDFAGGFRWVGHTLARKAGVSVDYIQGRIETLPFPDACFDACLCLLVLWSVSDRPRAIAELARVMRPGAPLIVAEFVLSAENHVRLPFGRPYASERELIDALSPYFGGLAQERRGGLTYVRGTRGSHA